MAQEKKEGENRQLAEVNSELLRMPDCKISKTSLQFEESITADDFEKIGEGLLRMKGAIPFWLGDWCLFAENNPDLPAGRLIYQARAYYNDRTIKNAVSVCRKIEPARRREKLSFGHHQAVTSLKPAEQDEFLADAEKYGFSVKELRQQVKIHKLESHKTNGERRSFILGDGKGNRYYYIELIKSCTALVASLVGKIKILGSFKAYAKYAQIVKPILCEYQEEKALIEACNHLLAGLEFLLDTEIKTDCEDGKFKGAGK